MSTLPSYEQHAAPLVAAFRQIRAGQRDPAMLAQQDVTYAAVIRRALDALDGQVTIPEELWKAVPLSVLLGMVVAAAIGDQVRRLLLASASTWRRCALTLVLLPCPAGWSGSSTGTVTLACPLTSTRSTGPS